jgi:hypothetical protein
VTGWGRIFVHSAIVNDLSSAISLTTFRHCISSKKVKLPVKKGCPGTDVMIFKIFSPKNSKKKMAFLTQNKAKLCKMLIITLVFEKNANYFAENCQKSQKIVIITSTPGQGHRNRSK